jgi:hypothetical protein
VSLATFLVACSDTSTTNDTTTDGGPGGPDGTSGGPGDAGGDAPTTPVDAGSLAKVQLVNAATDLGPADPLGSLRICYALGTAEASAVMAPLPALPETVTPPLPFAGLPIGGGGSIPGTGTDLSHLVIVPYLLNAQSLFARGIVKPAGAPSASCDALFDQDAGGALTAGVDYWKLPSIPAETLTRDKSFLLVLTGCAGDATSGGKCGVGFTAGAPGNGNLQLKIIELNRATTIDSDKIGAQFIHASTAGDVALGSGIQNPGFIADPTSAATFKSVSPDGGTVPYGSSTPLVQVAGVKVTTDSFTTNPLVESLAIPLAEIQQLTFAGPAPDGGAYRNGAAFTFVALGDPGQSPDAGGGAFNPKTYHYLAFPNDPTILTYAP